MPVRVFDHDFSNELKELMEHPAIISDLESISVFSSFETAGELHNKGISQPCSMYINCLLDFFLPTDPIFLHYPVDTKQLPCLKAISEEISCVSGSTHSIFFPIYPIVDKG